MENKKELLPEQRVELNNTLKNCFRENIHRHKGLEWPKEEARLENSTEKLRSLHQMEETSGEPLLKL